MSRIRPGRTAPLAVPSEPDVPTGGLERVVTATVWIVAIATVALGLNRLEPIAQNLSLNPTRIEWMNVPGWLADAQWHWVLDGLEQIPEFGPDSLIHDREVTAWVAKNIHDSPWIERIEKITKTGDGRVRVYAHFRKPFTMIEKDGWAHLIDETGVRLPGRVPSRDVDHTKGLTIVGVRGETPEEGQLWAGQDVQDGIKLVRFLLQAEYSGSLPVRSFLTSVDVSNFDGSRNDWAGRLRIVTVKPGNYIHWGRPPHEEYNIEAEAAKKLEAMCEESRIRLWFNEDRPIDIRAGTWVDQIRTP